MTEKNNKCGFVLIHGGSLESWVWDKVIPYLQSPSIAAHRIPDGKLWKSLTIDDCARYIIKQIEQAGFSKAVLVAHSIAGVIAPQVAVLAPDLVSHIIFVSANIPKEGKSAASAFPFGIRLQMRIGQLLAKLNSTPKEAMEQWLRKTLANDLEEDDIQFMINKGMNPEPSALLFDSISRKSMPSIPCTYVKLLNDKALNPELQIIMAGRVGATIREINSGHTVMLGKPKEFASLLNEVAGSTFENKV